MEAIVFASGDPISVSRIAQALEVNAKIIDECICTLQKKYNRPESGVNLIAMENGVQFSTNPAYADAVRDALNLRRNLPLSQASLEVLAIIAYNQPVTKAFVEQVRGVDCSAVIGSLMQKNLIEERGRLDLPGKPLLYGTSDVFLRCFDISSLAELPDIPRQADMQSVEERKDQELSKQFPLADK